MSGHGDSPSGKIGTGNLADKMYYTNSMINIRFVKMLCTVADGFLKVENGQTAAGRR